ncbi:MAG: hypothetical protein QN192_12355, partial [Armatimonadota bacterium]|nr:hypothetical protein [Armatimonadota bacterium]
LTGRVDTLDTDLRRQMEALDTKLTGRMDALEADLRRQISALDARLGNWLRWLVGILVVALVGQLGILSQAVLR